MNIFTKFYAFLEWHTAITQAEKSYEKYNKRFYVIKGDNGHLVVTDRKNFRGLRDKHWIRGAKGLDMRDVARLAFYHTAHANGVDFITGSEIKEKREEFYFWFVQSKRDWKNKQKKMKAAAKEKKRQIKKAKKDAHKK